MSKKPHLTKARSVLDGKKSSAATVEVGTRPSSPIAAKSSNRRMPLRWLSRFFVWFFTSKLVRVSIIGSFVVGLVLVLYLLKDLPSPRRLTNSDNFAVSTQIFDRNGKLLYEIYADENRIPIKIDDLPPHVWQAAIAIEDKNFFKHFGFDVSGIARAAIATLSGKRLEGGSTITQQLVKNALLTNERSLQRKVKEGMLSIMTEALYTKEEILEMYLNYISYGGTSVGIEAAAQSYFDKHAKDLTVAEAALLAGLPQAPSRYSPFGSQPETAKNRQKDVIRRMREDGYINPAQAASAETEVMNYALSKTDIQAPHFVFYVRDLLYELYGEDKVERGGLRVHTTLDLDLHNVAQASLSAEIDSLERYRVSNGAALIVKPNTGEILSMIGSRDYFDATHDGKVNVTIAERQPGSSIKPIMYATTFQEKTLNPGTILIDTPTCFQITGQKPYCPKNYDGGFKGAISVRESLGNSLNIPAVKAIATIGVPTFMDQAKDMGISTWNDPSRYGLSLSLGGGEVKMIELVQAFSVLANQGVKVPLTPILKIEDYTGEVLMETNTEERLAQLRELTETTERSAGDLERVMDRAPAYLTSHIMQDNRARTRAFGSRSELVIPDQIVSAKTGTTNDLRDNWTVGFTPEFLVMTWVGNNDNTPMNRSLVSGVTGAAPIFNDIMTYVLQGREATWQEKPADVLSAQVCQHGMPKQGNEPCQLGATELYWRESKPSLSSVETKEVWIDPRTGLPPPYGEVVEGLVLETRTVYTDPVTDVYCSDCTRPVTEEGNIQYEQYMVGDELQTEREERRTQTQTQTTE